MSELTDPRPDDRNGSDPRESGPLRVSRRSFVGAGMAAVLIGGASSGPAQAEPPAEGSTEEWRNKQPGMTYRRLGRTGMMVSEVVCGGDPITLKNFRHLEKALEMGLNYLDMAPAYNGGDTERAYGRLLEGSPSKRDKVFLTTKVSDFNRVRERMYQEIFDGLSGSKQEAINRRARALRRERAVEKPGYALTYFPGQQKAFDSAYRRVAMMAEYGERVEASSELRKTMVRSIEGSLKRVGTDHFDILMCPHGANTPEDLDSPEILETFKTLKQQGKVRFLGVTAHNDPAGVLHAAADKGFYDVVMMAYNVVNGGYVEGAIRQAWSRGSA